MQITTSQLNQVANLMGTTDKNTVVRAVLCELFNQGISVDVAFDFVFGEGAYIKFAGQVYEALNA